ncbi:MAG: hypothetical protein PUB26_01210, partial [Mycoplasmataceae bacterium]|nr:hypothetical protein [Mycoplasmataceae bacterium]
ILCCTYCTMHVQLTKLNEKIELKVIENTDVLFFAKFNTIFTSYELKLTSVFSCYSHSLSNALVLYLSIRAGCLIAGFMLLLWLIKDMKINY